MILLIDNYDSFSYNLVQLIGELTDGNIKVVRNDEITIDEIKKGDIVYANATYSNGTSNYIRFNSKSGKQGWVKVAELSKLPTNMFKRIVYRTH